MSLYFSCIPCGLHQNHTTEYCSMLLRDKTRTKLVAKLVMGICDDSFRGGIIPREDNRKPQQEVGTTTQTQLLSAHIFYLCFPIVP